MKQLNPTQGGADPEDGLMLLSLVLLGAHTFRLPPFMCPSSGYACLLCCI